MERMGVEKGVGTTQVVRKELRKVGPAQVCRGSQYGITRRNAYYPDFAFRLDGKRKCLQVLSVVGPSKFAQGSQQEAVSCFNRLQAEGDATCMEEYGKRLGYVYSSAPSSTIFFTAMFKYVFGGGKVKWVNPLPFDRGAEDLVMSLARDAREWIDFFQRNISKLKDSPTHTTLSLVLQLDVINCEALTARVKAPLDVRFATLEGGDGDDGDAGVCESQGTAKRRKRGVRFRTDRCKWVAEFNPPGKKNNKISLGEYDTLAEAARAADAGMFCYGSRPTSRYNFPDSPFVLQRAPRPVSIQDKEAVRRWARDFARLTAAPPPSLPGIDNIPPAVPTSSRRITRPPIQTFKPAVAISLPPSLSPAQSMPSFPNSYNPAIVASESTSGPSLHLEDVTEYMDMAASLNSLDHQAMLDSLDHRAMQINGSLPPGEAFYRPNDMDFWNASSPMCGAPEGIGGCAPGRTVSDMNGMVTDDLFQCIMSCNPTCNAEVERRNVQLIR